MVEILTNQGYISMDKLEQLLSAIVSRPQTFGTTVQHAMTDVNSGKTFSIPNFPKSCIIKEIRIRSNFISGQQTWRVAFVNNTNGITPTDTSISCQTAEIFQVGDCIYIEDEMAYVSAVDIPNSTITVTRGIKGTTASYHNFGARMETTNDGLRLTLFKKSSRKLAERLKIMKDLMSWKGNTNAAITVNDKVIKFANSPSNISKYDYLYIMDGNNSERASVEDINEIVKDVTYNNTIYVADPLLAHVANIDVQKQMINDIPIIFSGGDGNIYGTVFVDEKIDSTVYPSGVNISIDIITENFYTR